MATAGHILDIARGQLGYHEDPPSSNQNKFSTYWHHGAEPWCADFACWVLQTGGALDVPMSAYTPTLAESYQHAGRWYHSPAAGDLVFFQWSDSNRICHVGVVESVRSDGSIVTLEGNTDSGGSGHGGAVMRHVRSGSTIKGYGRPKYTAASKPAPAPAPAKKRTPPTVRKGDTGANVKKAQTALNSHGASPKLKPDGDFGAKTDRAVRAFQKAKRLTVDAVIGPKTWRALGF